MADTASTAALEATLPKRDLSHTPKKYLVLGATSGIAEATCRIWAAQGANIFLVGRSADKLNAMAGDLRVRGAAFVDTAVADLDTLETHADLMAHAITQLGGLDVAYLAVGILGDQPQAEQDAAHAEQILHTNLTAPVSMLTWLANFCAKQGHGVLAVLSSVAGDRGRKSNYVYGASKAGLTAFVDGLRNRLDREGIAVLTIKPGPTKTAMTAGMPKQEKMADPNAVAKTIAAAIAKGEGGILYVPGIWWPIMTVIKAIPDSVFKKLNL
jgi:decaprenylphospho-beta-D-erythro-pentofuranosid-2-ulose 2-reductase